MKKIILCLLVAIILTSCDDRKHPSDTEQVPYTSPQLRLYESRQNSWTHTIAVQDIYEDSIHYKVFTYGHGIHIQNYTLDSINLTKANEK